MGVGVGVGVSISVLALRATHNEEKDASFQVCLLYNTQYMHLHLHRIYNPKLELPNTCTDVLSDLNFALLSIYI